MKNSLAGIDYSSFLIESIPCIDPYADRLELVG